MKSQEQDEALAVLLFRAALFLFITYALLIGVRVTVAPMQPSGMLFILATSTILIVTMMLAYFRLAIRPAGYFFLGGITSLVISRAYLAGGSDSPVLIMLIIAPIAAMFLLGRLAGVIFSGIALTTILVFIWLRASGHEFPSLLMEGMSLGIVQSSVIIFVMAVSSWIAWLYARHNDALTSKLQEQAHRDHLTGVPNRRAFDLALVKEIRLAKRQQQPLTLFMVDLDHFKSFNDMYGHYEGDQCLIKVSNIIQSCLRRPGDMVARYGGEEFAVILPDTPMQQAHQLAETMRHAVLGLNIEHQDSSQKVVTITLGISGMDLDKDVQPETLIMRADEALYAGKEAGRNQVFITESGQTQLESETAR